MEKLGHGTIIGHVRRNNSNLGFDYWTVTSMITAFRYVVERLQRTSRRRRTGAHAPTKQLETNLQKTGELKPIITNASLTFKDKRTKERERRNDLSLGRSSLDRPILFRLLLKFAYHLKNIQTQVTQRQVFDL